jgi:hypothetical protein
MITIHYKTVVMGGRVLDRPWCGAYGHTRLTADLAEVTCARCLKYLRRDGLSGTGTLWGKGTFVKERG